MVSKYIPLLPNRKLRLDSALAEFSRQLGLCNSSDDVYHEIVRLLSGHLNFHRLTIWIIDPDPGTMTHTFVWGDPIPNWDRNLTRPLANSASDEILKSGNPIVIADCSDSAVLARFSNLDASAAQLPALVGVPLEHHGKIIGSMVARSREKAAFSDRDVEIMRLAAAHASPTVVNALQLAELQREVHMRTVLADISRSVSSTIDFSLVWGEFVQAVRDLVPCDRLVIALLDEDGEFVEDRYIWGVAVPGWDDMPRHSIKGLPTEQMLGSRLKEIVSVEETDRQALKLLGYKMSERTGLHSSMYVPLIAGDRLIGTLNVKALEPDVYSKDELDLLERLAMQVGGSIAAAELYLRTIKLAEEKEARAQVELKNQRMTESNEIRSRFISAISHELRTPLTSIIAFANILGGNGKVSEDAKSLQQLDVIRRNAERLRVLIEDLLDISSIETENLRLTRTSFSLRDAISNVAMSLKPMIDAKAQRLVTEYSEPEIVLVTDRIRIDQILSNLVTNASKYSRAYTEIKIAAVATDGTVRITVSDEGEGMTEEEAAVIFDEFTRLDNEATKSSVGQGLGLAVSQHLAKALGGEIAVTSEKGKGSVFVLTVPAMMVDQPDAQAI